MDDLSIRLFCTGYICSTESISLVAVINRVGDTDSNESKKRYSSKTMTRVEVPHSRYYLGVIIPPVFSEPRDA